MKKPNNDLQDNYITIQSWMISELKLKGNSLLIYALIYGFSQTKKQVCTCGDEYMAAWTNSSLRNIIACKNELIDKKLIKKVPLKQDARKSGYQASRSEIGEESSHIFCEKTAGKSKEQTRRKDKEKQPKSCPQLGEESSGTIPEIGEESSHNLRNIHEESSCKKELYMNFFPKIGEESSRASYYKTNYTSDDNIYNIYLTARTRAEWETQIVDNCNIESLRESFIACFGKDEAVDKVLESLLDFLMRKQHLKINDKEFEYLEVAEKIDKLNANQMCDLAQKLYVKNESLPPQKWKLRAVGNMQNYLISIILKSA